MKIKQTLFLISVFFCLTVAGYAQGGAVKILRNAMGEATMLVPPAIVPSSLSRTAAAGMNSLLQSQVAKAATTPPTLNLTYKIVPSGQAKIFLHHSQIDLYLNYALPRAPISQVLKNVRLLQKAVNNENNFFVPLATKYYFDTFHRGSPKLKDFFKEVGAQNNPDLEEQVLTRLETLAQSRQAVGSSLNVGSNSLIVKYMGWDTPLSSQPFDPNSLVLTFERMLSSQFKSDLFPALSSSSAVYTPRGKFSTQYYKNVEDMVSLYSFLLNGYGPQKKMFLSTPTPKNFFLFNEDKTSWIRVSDHEYESAAPHVHLEKMVPTQYTVNGKTVNDYVLFNLRIQLSRPRFLNTAVVDESIWRTLLIDKPQRILTANPLVTVE